MTTHYDVLGVQPSATTAEIRTAYYARARTLHPDAMAGRSATEVDAARRAMQDVNEAWRVLRDPGQRAAYDRVLETPPPEPVVVHREDDLDRVYERPLAQPGDLSVLIVRAVPWIAVLLVLGIIFVFTAIAGRDDGPRDLVGKCVITEDAEPVETPCDRQNDGRLVDVVSDSKECAVGTTAKIVSDGDWLCLEPAP